jgi:molecular chaperone DnaK
LNKDDIERMRHDAEAHAADDTRRKEEVETRNNADNLAYTAEKTLRDNKDKIPSDLNTEIEGKIKAVRDALQGQDMNALRQAAQDLNTTMQKVGSSVYGQQQPPGGQPGGGQQPPPPPPGGKGPEGTVEGEFREV